MKNELLGFNICQIWTEWFRSRSQSQILCSVLYLTQYCQICHNKIENEKTRLISIFNYNTLAVSLFDVILYPKIPTVCCHFCFLSTNGIVQSQLNFKLIGKIRIFIILFLGLVPSTWSFLESLKNQMSQPEVVARIKYETSTAFRIDESKRPKNEGPVESFRKLNVDWIEGK